MGFKIKDGISSVGKIDWELRKFHGEEYSTHKGTSYNSYLVQDQKTVLIDTVWQPFAEEFINNLKKEIDLNTIDYIIANHSEPDHNGALPLVMKEIPNTPIYCTANGKKVIEGYYPQNNWNFVEVKTGDRLNLGSKEIIFIEARMLHWPDTMFSYLTKDNILFSTDAFGAHFASEFMYNDLVDECHLFEEAIKYYVNIISPFSPLVAKKIKELKELNLPIEMICPSHGVIWRKDPLQIVEKYAQWAENYQENQVTIIYDSMWNSTRKMAETIANGIQSVDPSITVKIYNSGKSDNNDIITEVFKSKIVAVGSPTINGGMLSSTAAILEEMRGMRFKKKKAVAFGSYGWSGETVKMINEALQKGGFEIIDDGLKLLWVPDDEGLNQCFDLGTRLANH